MDDPEIRFATMKWDKANITSALGKQAMGRMYM